MTNRWRAVLDTNIFISAALTRNPASPAREVLQRWEHGEFVLLTCETLADEVIEKLLARKIPWPVVAELIATLDQTAAWVAVPPAAIAALLPDPDDNVVVACAVIGQAHFLVTYDQHFAGLGGAYRGVKIVKALPFLWAVRGDQLPGGNAPTE